MIAEEHVQCIPLIGIVGTCADLDFRMIFQVAVPGSAILVPLVSLGCQLFPVGNLFVKNVFYLCRTQFLHRIGFIHRQHISLFYDFFIKKSQSFRKQEYDNQQNSNARYKTAASQYPFYNLFPNSFHTVLVFYFNNRCKKSLFILR